MSLLSAMWEILRPVTVKDEVDEATEPCVVLAMIPPESFAREMMVSKVVEPPWFVAGKNPSAMFVKTTSTKVLVAFLNSMENQFSNEVRRASTCPSKTVLTALLVEPGDLCRTMESKSSNLPSGISSTSVVEALKSEKNSPCPSISKASPPEKESVEPAKGEPVAETTPEVKVDEP